MWKRPLVLVVNGEEHRRLADLRPAVEQHRSFRGRKHDDLDDASRSGMDLPYTCGPAGCVVKVVMFTPCRKLRRRRGRKSASRRCSSPLTTRTSGRFHMGLR